MEGQETLTVDTGIMRRDDYWLCEIDDSSGRSKRPRTVLIFTSGGGFRINMNVEIRCPSRFDFKRLLNKEYFLAQIIQNPPERPGTTLLGFAQRHNPEIIRAKRYLPSSACVTFACYNNGALSDYGKDRTPITAWRTFEKSWHKAERDRKK
jgi:hypothetical protein